MKKSSPPENQTHGTEVIIPQEKAVFWMDGHGRWCNRHGRFEHKRIIDHFNRSLEKDEDGYYVTQVRGDIREKVYFPYEETPLFVTRIVNGDPVQLVLNTGETVDLEPSRLYVKTDHLYFRRDHETIKFGDRALMAMAPYLEGEADCLCIRIGDRAWPIPERGTV